MNDVVTILFLAADPFRDRAALRLDEEVRAIDAALQRGRARDGVALATHFATRTGDLQHALLRHQPRVVHFAGHGDEPGIVLGDEHGRPRMVAGETLARLFGILRDTRLVVLNACDTLATADALRGAVDFAVGMRRPLPDDAAVRFAAGFYGALAMGRAVETAYALGVNQLELEHGPDADTPVLRVRDGADPGAPLTPRPADAPGAAPSVSTGAIGVFAARDSHAGAIHIHQPPGPGGGPA